MVRKKGTNTPAKGESKEEGGEHEGQPRQHQHLVAASSSPPPPPHVPENWNKLEGQLKSAVDLIQELLNTARSPGKSNGLGGNGPPPPPIVSKELTEQIGSLSQQLSSSRIPRGVSFQHLDSESDNEEDSDEINESHHPSKHQRASDGAEFAELASFVTTLAAKVDRMDQTLTQLRAKTEKDLSMTRHEMVRRARESEDRLVIVEKKCQDLEVSAQSYSLMFSQQASKPSPSSPRASLKDNSSPPLGAEMARANDALMARLQEVLASQKLEQGKMVQEVTTLRNLLEEERKENLEVKALLAQQQAAQSSLMDQVYTRFDTMKGEIKTDLAVIQQLKNVLEHNEEREHEKTAFAEKELAYVGALSHMKGKLEATNTFIHQQREELKMLSPSRVGGGAKREKERNANHELDALLGAGLDRPAPPAMNSHHQQPHHAPLPVQRLPSLPHTLEPHPSSLLLPPRDQPRDQASPFSRSHKKGDSPSRKKEVREAAPVPIMASYPTLDTRLSLGSAPATTFSPSKGQNNLSNPPYSFTNPHHYRVFEGGQPLSLSQHTPLESLHNTSSFRSQMVVSFSGFKADGKEGYTTQDRQMLIQLAERLGATVVLENEFDDSITHCIVAPGCRTMKALGVCAKGGWLLTTEWVTASAEAGRWLNEENYGRKLEELPLQNKRFYFSPAFQEEQKRKAGDRLRNGVELIKIGKGEVVDTESFDVDYTIIASVEQQKFSGYGLPLVWSLFLNLIPIFSPPALARAEGNDLPSPSKPLRMQPEAAVLLTPSPKPRKRLQASNSASKRKRDSPEGEGAPKRSLLES